MPNQQQHHTEYAPPVLRAPSPASSIGTSYPEDQTSLSDVDLDDVAFEKKWEERLQLGLPTDEEEQANLSPLLPRPAPGSDEEKEMFNNILDNLRDTIEQLEDEELFEQMVLRGSRIGLEQQPTTTDIDALMRSMMIVPGTTTSTSSQEVSESLVQLNGTNINGISNEREGRGTAHPTGMIPGKRSRNGTRRN